MTDRQYKVLRLVYAATMNGAWYRAVTKGYSGGGERVTLASLFRAGPLERRAWRGVAGEPDAAYEYKIKAEYLTAGVAGKENSNG